MVPYIYNEYMSSTVSIIAISVDTKIATCNIIKIIMGLEENHTFLVIETPRSVLFFNYVAFSFASPEQNKKKSALDTEGFNESRLVVTRPTLYHAAT